MAVDQGIDDRPPAGRGSRRAAWPPSARRSWRAHPAAPTGKSRHATSLISSTRMPPAPTTSIGPNSGSRARADDDLDALDHLLHQEAIELAPGANLRAAVARACASRSTSGADLRLRRTPPASVLWLICAETILSATGKPMRAASAAASPGEAARPLLRRRQSVALRALPRRPGPAASRRGPRGGGSGAITRPAARPVEGERGQRPHGLRQALQIREADLLLKRDRLPVDRKIHAHEGDHRLVGALRHAAQEGRIARALAARQGAAPGQHVDIGVGRDGAAQLAPIPPRRPDCRHRADSSARAPARPADGSWPWWRRRNPAPWCRPSRPDSRTADRPCRPRWSPSRPAAPSAAVRSGTPSVISTMSSSVGQTTMP